MMHGYMALVAEFIGDFPRRRYGRAMMRHLARQCGECWEADERRARISRMHRAYRRRGTR